MKKILIVLLGVVALTGCRTDRAARIDSIITSTDKNSLARSVAVIQGHTTITMKGYGFADVENDVPATAETVYPIASISKEFTAAAIMQLVEQGRVSLDDDIVKYVPNAPVYGHRVLIRHLLNHTSGIPSYTDVLPLERIGSLPTHDALLATLTPYALMFEPGTHFYYNNTGYHLLGMVIEKVTGKTFGEALKSMLFQPLGLTSTSYCDSRAIIKHRARGYSIRRGQPLNVADPFFQGDSAAAKAEGGLCSTVVDLTHWTAALASGGVVSEKSYEQMITPVALPSGRKMIYGFGLQIGEIGSHRVISHPGGIPGFSSYLAYFPDDSLTVCVIANANGTPVEAFAMNIARLILGMPLQEGPPNIRDLPTTAEIRAKLVGTYSMMQADASKTTARVVEKDATLEFQYGLQPFRRLLYQGGDTFAVDGKGPWRVTFDIVDAKATGFVFDESGVQPLEALRTTQ